MLPINPVLQELQSSRILCLLITAVTKVASMQAHTRKPVEYTYRVPYFDVHIAVAGQGQCIVGKLAGPSPHA